VSTTKGGAVANLTDEQRAFLRNNAWPAIVTTLRGDGSPHSTVVWVDEVDGEVWFNTVVGRAKERQLRRDPRASLILVDPSNQFRWVAVSGPATFQTDGADEHIDKLAKKYLGQDSYPWPDPSQRRIIVRIRPEKVDSTGFDGS
jgi:PPOX class probable F420-dependent enzyme